jgi:zinc D-Ala-D-Ala dipeptidase
MLVISSVLAKITSGVRFEKYVANPAKGSMHNYGIAVDITIVDERGNKLDMGPSPFYSGHATIYWNYFLKKMGFGISDEQQKNHDLLKRVMLNAGFHSLSHEWWHFNGTGFHFAIVRHDQEAGDNMAQVPECK